MKTIKVMQFLNKAFVFALILTVVSVIGIGVLPVSMANANTAYSQGSCDLYCSFYSSSGALIPGGATQSSKAGLSHVKGFTLDSERILDEDTQTYGKLPTLEPFRLIKKVDKASPRLLKAFWSNEKLQKMELKAYMVNSTGAEYVAYTIALRGVKITARKVYTDTDVQYEALTLKFDEKREVAIESKVPAINPSTIMGTVCQMNNRITRNITGTKWQQNLTSGFFLDNLNNEIGRSEDTGEITCTYTIKKQLDKASPKLQLSLESGESFIVTLNTSQDIYGDGSAQLAYVTTLKDASIISRRIFSETDQYNFTKIYEEITFEYNEISESDIVSKISF